MPQMAPLNWLTLAIFFISALLMMSIINYYSLSYHNTKKSSDKIKKLQLNWKWQ